MLDKITAWAKRPFADDMDVWHWIIFTFFVMTIAVLWMQILNWIGE